MNKSIVLIVILFFGLTFLTGCTTNSGDLPNEPPSPMVAGTVGLNTQGGDSAGKATEAIPGFTPGDNLFRINDLTFKAKNPNTDRDNIYDDNYLTPRIIVGGPNSLIQEGDVVAVYKTAYYSINGDNWKPVTLDGPALGGNWLKTIGNDYKTIISGDYIANKFAYEPGIVSSGNTYYIVFVCKHTGTFWDCFGNQWTINPFAIQLEDYCHSVGECYYGNACYAVGVKSPGDSNTQCVINSNGAGWESIYSQDYCTSNGQCYYNNACYSPGMFAEGLNGLCNDDLTWAILPKVLTPGGGTCTDTEASPDPYVQGEIKWSTPKEDTILQGDNNGVVLNVQGENQATLTIYGVTMDITQGNSYDYSWVYLTIKDIHFDAAHPEMSSVTIAASNSKDRCEDSNNLVEYYCNDNGDADAKLIQCAGGCSDGKCTTVSNQITLEVKNIKLSASEGYAEFEVRDIGNNLGAIYMSSEGKFNQIGDSLTLVINGVSHAVSLASTALNLESIYVDGLGPYMEDETFVLSGSTSSLTLANYPQPFVTPAPNGVFNSLFIVGNQDISQVNVGMTDITSSLQRYAGVNALPPGLVKTDNEVSDNDLYNSNVVIVGNTCSNTATAKFYGVPEDCNANDAPGVGHIKIIRNKNPSKQVVLVHGYSINDTLMATRVLANWENYKYLFASTDSLCVTGTLSAMTVQACPIDISDDKSTICTDSDGTDTTTQGTIFGKIQGSSYMKSDYCIDPVSVKEYYCNEGFLKEMESSCKYGCYEGKCKPTLTDPISCTDTDGGSNPLKPGFVYGFIDQGNNQGVMSFKRTDFCTGNVLSERVCVGTTNHGMQDITCENGCDEDRCIPAFCQEHVTVQEGTEQHVNALNGAVNFQIAAWGQASYGNTEQILLNVITSSGTSSKGLHKGDVFVTNGQNFYVYETFVYNTGVNTSSGAIELCYEPPSFVPFTCLASSGFGCLGAPIIKPNSMTFSVVNGLGYTISLESNKMSLINISCPGKTNADVCELGANMSDCISSSVTLKDGEGSTIALNGCTFAENQTVSGMVFFNYTSNSGPTETMTVYVSGKTTN